MRKLENEMAPIETPRYTVGPVALLCATAAFLGMLSTFLILVLYAPKEAEIYLRPLVPTFAALGSAALIWFRASRSQAVNSAENRIIIGKADKAAVKADQAATVVNKQLNGELDKRIQDAVTAALNAPRTEKVGTTAIEKPEE